MAGPYPSLSLRQALIAQHDRLLKLTTILGDDMLLPQRVMGHDRLGRSYEYVVDTVSVRSDIELKSSSLSQSRCGSSRRTARICQSVVMSIPSNDWGVTASSLFAN
jgi:hypothetical protein